ncbi:Gfo/Idh/MocA family protein [Rhodocaloribacter litoris]|uniref:Gfo/Idh/MocA family protein n=1 Tax=Rhodocaloribacter litoris TaxID=2558931 RepID=UPI002342C361
MHLAIIGTGGMAHHHAKVFGALEGCTLAAACDIDRERVEAFARTFGVPETYTDVDALLERARVDAVVVATPDHVHAPIAIKAAAAGKHILCEKPLALNYEEARAMAEAAERAGIIHMVNFSYRRSPALQKARALVEAGALGRIMHFSAHYLQSWLASKVWGDWRTEPAWLWRLSTAHHSLGVLGDVGVHILDFVSFPAGDFRSVQCRLKTFPKAEGERIGPYVLDANDSALIVAELESGAAGVIHTSRWATGYQNAIALTLHGDRGALRIDLDRGYDLLDVCLEEDVDTVTWRTVTCPPVPANEERFLECIRTGRRADPDFHRGAAIQRVLDACFASDASGTAVDVSRWAAGQPPGAKA